MTAPVPDVAAREAETKAETRRRHAAWLRECARRAEALAAEYRANADRIDAEADAALAVVTTPGGAE